MSKAKYYVVWKGHNTGVFSSWEECRKQVEKYEGAEYKSFSTLEGAQKAFQSLPEFGNKESKTCKQTSRFSSPLRNSLSVDAACSGNPGEMEYRGVETHSKKVIFQRGPYPRGTNNIGEFLAIVHALALLKKYNSPIPVYTDSNTAIIWVKNKKANTKLERIPENEELFEMVYRAECWLQENSWPNDLLKWDTESWGEIPADFGRK